MPSKTCSAHLGENYPPHLPQRLPQVPDLCFSRAPLGFSFLHARVVHPTEEPLEASFVAHYENQSTGGPGATARVQGR